MEDDKNNYLNLKFFSQLNKVSTIECLRFSMVNPVRRSEIVFLSEGIFRNVNLK